MMMMMRANEFQGRSKAGRQLGKKFQRANTEGINSGAVCFSCSSALRCMCQASRGVGGGNLKERLLFHFLRDPIG